MNENKRKQAESQAQKGVIRKGLHGWVRPLVLKLDKVLDKRIVMTFLQLVEVILTFRHNNYGLLLSELGGYVGGWSHAPAGTKRVGNLVRHAGWDAGVVADFIENEADQHLDRMEAAEELALAVWDQSVWEKPESLALEGLCPVVSSKAKRLSRLKPGYYRPPSAPVVVPGENWLGVVLVGLRSLPQLAKWQWWSTRGEAATTQRAVEGGLLVAVIQRWGKRLLHVFDRGYAGEPWLVQLVQHAARFLMRWRKDYCLTDANGTSRKAWQITQGKRSLDHRMIRDVRRGCERKTGIYYTPVSHPACPTPLTLIVSRPGKGRPPWYLLTNELVASTDDAWCLVLAYHRRWTIETCWRFAKADLAFQSPRLHAHNNRLKLLAIASLAFAFLLHLLAPTFDSLCQWLLRAFCHRTGNHLRAVKLPLYRLRAALSHLWLDSTSPFSLNSA